MSENILYAYSPLPFTATFSSTEIKLVGFTLYSGLPNFYILIRRGNQLEAGAGIVGMVIISSKWLSLQE